jgi:hypothetical protein
LFNSPTISPSTSAPVGGTQYLTAGSYHFICTIHGSSMSGDLTVNAGTPAARPDIHEAIRSTKIATVVNQKKLKVTASSVNGAPSKDSLTDPPGRLVAKVGSTTLTKAVSVTVPFGGSVNLSLGLTSAGKRKLKALAADGRKARVRLLGSVRYGMPTSTIRRLKPPS